MKPTERIVEIAGVLLSALRAKAPPENLSRYHREYVEASMLRAIGKYLDEQHEERERERRGLAAVMAMGIVRANGSIDLARKYVERAGLKPLVYEGSLIDGVVEEIEREAREAGIL